MSRHVYFNCHVCSIQTLKNNGKGCNKATQNWKVDFYGKGRTLVGVLRIIYL